MNLAGWGWGAGCRGPVARRRAGAPSRRSGGNISTIRPPTLTHPCDRTPTTGRLGNTRKMHKAGVSGGVVLLGLVLAFVPVIRGDCGRLRVVALGANMRNTTVLPVVTREPVEWTFLIVLNVCIVIAKCSHYDYTGQLLLF